MERQRKFHKSLKISKSTNDLALARAAFDPSVLRKLEEKLSNLFELDRIESLVTGWELGKRCTLINKDKALTGAFKSGRLFLTEGHLLFMRYVNAQLAQLSLIALTNKCAQIYFQQVFIYYALTEPLYLCKGIRRNRRKISLLHWETSFVSKKANTPAGFRETHRRLKLLLIRALHSALEHSPIATTCIVRF